MQEHTLNTVEEALAEYYAETGDTRPEPELDIGSGDPNTRMAINRENNNRAAHHAANQKEQP